MPPENIPVVVRTSAEAHNFWARHANSSVTASLRLKDGNNNPSAGLRLFRDEDLSMLPYRRQFNPMTLTWPSSLPPSSIPPSSHSSTGGVRTSREIELLIMQNEMKEMEKNQSMFALCARKNERSLLNINRALAKHLAEHPQH